MRTGTARMTKATRFVAALSLFAVAWAIAACAQLPLFVPAAASPVVVGRGSGEIVLADVDRDGHLDLVARHLLERSLTIQLGDGAGRFAPAAGSPLRLEFEPGAMAVGDVDGDGILDLAIASRDGGGELVHVLAGNGRGGFARVTGSPVASSESMLGYKPAIRLADVNEDGNLDIVTANGRRNTIEVLAGDGRGGFSAPRIVTLEPGRSLYSFDLGDLDGDGHLDLALASSASDGGPGRVGMRRGDGKGAFQETLGPPVSVEAAPRLARLVDLNGDRRLDLVIGHGTALSVLFNQGRGELAPSAGSALDFGRDVYETLAADADRDGNADLIVATVSHDSPFHSRIAVIIGDGRWFAQAPGSPFPAGRGAYHLAVGDVDEDGRLDVAASSFEGDAVTVLVGR